MIKSILSAFKHRIADSDLLASLRYRVRFPGLFLARGARITGSGNFSYGMGCSIGKRSRMVLNPGTRLSFGERCYVDEDVEIHPDGGDIAIGEETSVQKRCALLGELSIGSYCLFAPNVFVSSGTHQFALRPELLIRDQDDLVSPGTEAGRNEYSRKVVIEDDCWIGANVVIMRGVTVSKGSVIGANSVVTRDVPPYSITAGVPAQVIKARLPFAPKTSIDASVEQDWPYFYSGFTLRKSRQGVGPGLAVRPVFSVCLAGPAGARSIRLEIAPAPREYLIGYSGSEIPVAKGATACTFSVPAAPERGLHEFCVLEPGSRKPASNPDLRLRRALLE